MDTSVFPVTHRSAVAGLASGDAETRARSLDVITRAYWRPIYKYVRLRWASSAELAEDLVQSFFVRALDRDVLAGYEPGRGRFRTFLRTCLDRHVIDHHRRAGAMRRGGKLAHLDFTDAEAELAAQGGTRDPDAVFEAEWLRHMMGLALERLDAALTANGKPIHAKLFREFHVEESPPSYAEAAARHGIPTTTVTNWLHVARREFREIALGLVRELTLDDDDYAAEARAVFGIDVRGER